MCYVKGNGALGKNDKFINEELDSHRERWNDNVSFYLGLAQSVP